MDIDHVYETLKIGIDTLAAGTGSIQERLWETWMVIHTLNQDDLPLELRDDFRKLSEALTTPQESAVEAEPEARTVGQARAAYEGLDNEHARILALFIVQLFAYVSAEFWPTHKKHQSKTN
jgi:hypothetical protein